MSSFSFALFFLSLSLSLSLSLCLSISLPSSVPPFCNAPVTLWALKALPARERKSLLDQLERRHLVMSGSPWQRRKHAKTCNGDTGEN